MWKPIGAVLPYAAKTCGHFKNTSLQICASSKVPRFQFVSLRSACDLSTMSLVPTRGDFAATSLRDIRNCPGRPNDQYFMGKPKGTAERKIKYRDMSACAVCASLRWPSHSKLHTSKFPNHKLHTSKFQIAHFQMSNCKCTRDTTKSLIVQRSFIKLCTSVRRFVTSHPDNILLR